MSKLARKTHSILFDWVMKSHARKGLPAMTERERDFFTNALTRAPHDGELRIFEWGSGYSTVWAALLLSERNIPFHIDTIDNHRGWHERVRGMLADAGLADRVTLHLSEFPPFWEKPGWDWGKEPACGEFAPSSAAENAYVDMPQTLGGRFDVMLVDARFRRRCLEVASEVVRPDGFVLLHDAQKPWYQGPTKGFEHSRFIDSGAYYPTDPGDWQMWAGSHTNAVVDEL